MSVKSLLQIILLLLIFLIIGGIYFYYFKTNNKENMLINTQINQTEIQNNSQIENNDEILDEIKNRESLTDNNKNMEEGKNNGNKLTLNANSEKGVNLNEVKENKNNTQKSVNDVQNLTKEIEYITSNKNGDIYKILAKFGKTSLENSDTLDLERVNGAITSIERSDIFITSDYAKYNYTTQNSKFYDNVIIKYENKIITCDNFDLNISEDIAVAYSNVIVKDDVSIMKAQKITIDIITKDIFINSDKKVKIIKN